MRYFKNATPIGQFTDIFTGVTIRRGHIIALKQPTKAMKPFLMKKGILEVTEAEYADWAAKQPAKEIKEIVPSDQLPPAPDEFEEQKKVIAAEQKEKAEGGSLISSKTVAPKIAIKPKVDIKGK